MSANNSTKFYLLLLLMAILVDIGKTTRCGEYICDEKSTCVYNQEKSELNCICDEGFIKNIKDKFIFCYQPEIGNIVKNCLKVDDKCGPNHKCNEDLICQEINGDTSLKLTHAIIEGFVCNVTQEKCLDKCCLENELCQDGMKCITRDEVRQIPAVSLDVPCVEFGKCGDKCCFQNEVCTKENECIAKEILNILDKSTAFPCAESNKCEDKCCADNEICNNGKECILKLNVTVDCSETQKCLTKCCALNELCVNDTECVPKESIVMKCFDTQTLCQWKCCAENEKCNECIATEINDSECPAIQKCLDKCCNLLQICNANDECVDAANESSIISTIAVNFDCPVSQKCLNKCCFEHEKCNEKYECISIYTNQCPDITEICGNKCCPVNETCNEENECVAYLEVTTTDNCSQKLKCQDICCTPLQICNELNECVNKSLKDSTNLYDLPNEITTNKIETINDFDTIIPIYDFDDINKKISCPKYYYTCHQKCCHEQQICNKNGECEEQINKTNCVLGLSCLENVNLKDAKTSTVYTMIGLGCLITVMTFGLFKLYNFRRLQRISF